jgi:hypothetical protein
MSSFRRTIAVLAFLLGWSSLSRLARAGEQMIIKLPGDHPHYSFEAEPQLLLGWHELTDGPGVGFRGVVPLIDNGFVGSINNSVGFGFGFDADPVGTGKHFALPAVIQWNFWLATHWSVFGEAGLAITLDSGDARFGPVFYAGCRYHITRDLALTLRLGLPGLDAALGVSFFL